MRILVRGVPVAELGPIESGAPETDDDEELRLCDLERRGLIRRGKGGLEPAILKPGPRPRGRSGSQTVIDERRSGR